MGYVESKLSIMGIKMTGSFFFKWGDDGAGFMEKDVFDLDHME